jgi:hypothetical protein
MVKSIRPTRCFGQQLQVPEEDRAGGGTSFNFSRQLVYVKHYYFYLQDEHWGPALIKVGTYLPYPVRVCLNGHVRHEVPSNPSGDETAPPLAARNDPREVVTDPQARYYGVELSERTLVPGDDARLGETRFDDWLSQSILQMPASNPRPAVVAAAPKSL